MNIVALLNERFASGKPSNVLSEAGVLVRQFDTLDDWDKPWLPCPADRWCVGFSDRWATSIINVDAPHVYYDDENDGKGGIVLAPTAALFCAYPEDGNSMNPEHACTPLGGDGVNCIPGCYPKGQQCHEVGHDWVCSFPPDRLKQALISQQNRESYRDRNNEMIVDIRTVTSNLPHSIMAFWRKPNLDKDQQAHQAHANFLAEYKLTKENGPPLLVLDLKHGGSAPFRSLDPHALGGWA